MSQITLGIIGGGQLGSMLAISAKKLNIRILKQQALLKILNKTS